MTVSEFMKWRGFVPNAAGTGYVGKRVTFIGHNRARQDYRLYMQGRLDQTKALAEGGYLGQWDGDRIAHAITTDMEAAGERAA